MENNARSQNLTKSFIDKIQPPKDKEQAFYRDKELKGFALRVTKNGIKSFVIETRIDGKVKRFTLGKYGTLTAEEARKQAKIQLGKIVSGGNPIAEKKSRKIKNMTLQEVFNDYLRARKDLKPRTIEDYKNVLRQVLSDWLNKPIINITQEMVAKRHARYGQSSEARANNAMRVLRAVFNFATFEYQTMDGVPVLSVNPVKYLSHAKAWYRVDRKQTVIKSYQLAAWQSGLKQLLNQKDYTNASMWRDYFLLLLFTGMRKTEASSLMWDDIDLEAKTFTLRDTKNRQPHTLPMSDFVYELFLRRYQYKSSEYVFSAKSKTGYISEPRKAVLKVAELSGVPFTLHDLRRTFATTAESLDLPAYALKRLLNHKMNHDVTAGYIMHDAERLRAPMQMITDCLVSHMLDFKTKSENCVVDNALV